MLLVVYFDQGTHAFARLKTIENIRKSWKKFLFFSTWASHLHDAKLTWASRAHDGKGTFFIIFQCFSSFLTMQTHAQACVGWSKYTTVAWYWKLSSCKLNMKSCKGKTLNMSLKKRNCRYFKKNYTVASHVDIIPQFLKILWCYVICDFSQNSPNRF